MIFCLGDGRCERKGEGYQKSYRVFNKDVSESEYKKIKDSLDIKIKLTEYKDDELKVYSYEDAWSTWWNEASKEEKEKITGLKQFDAEIFKGITGIDIKNEEELEKLTMEEVCRELGRNIKIKK